MPPTRCPTCQQFVRGDIRFCTCDDARILGISPGELTNSTKLPVLLQGLIVIGFQLALLLLFHPLFHA